MKNTPTSMVKRLRVPAAALMAVGSLLVGANAVSAAGSRSPFNARFSGSAQFTSQTTTSFAGSGTATYMGRITTQGHADVTGPDSSCPGGVANTNVETLTSSDDGDTLTITSQDVACPTGPGQYHGTGHWTVTGGTGRFSGATGQGSLAGYVDFIAGTFTVNLSGNLVLLRGD